MPHAPPNTAIIPYTTDIESCVEANQNKKPDLVDAIRAATVRRWLEYEYGGNNATEQSEMDLGLGGWQIIYETGRGEEKSPEDWLDSEEDVLASLLPVKNSQRQEYDDGRVVAESESSEVSSGSNSAADSSVGQGLDCQSEEDITQDAFWKKRTDELAARTEHVKGILHAEKQRRAQQERRRSLIEPIRVMHHGSGPSDRFPITENEA